MRINVDRNRPLSQLGRIGHVMDWFERINPARVSHVHPIAARFGQLAGSSFTSSGNQAIVLHQEPTKGNSHPTILSAMVMDPTLLANFPANCQHLVEIGPLQEIASVMRAAEDKVGLQAIGFNGMAGHEPVNPV